MCDCQLADNCPAYPYPCLCKRFNPVANEHLCFYCGTTVSDSVLWCDQCDLKVHAFMGSINHPSLKWIALNRRKYKRRYLTVLSSPHARLEDIDQAYEQDVSELEKIKPVERKKPPIVQPDKKSKPAKAHNQNRLKALLKPVHRRL